MIHMKVKVLIDKNKKKLSKANYPVYQFACFQELRFKQQQTKLFIFSLRPLL